MCDFVNPGRAHDKIREAKKNARPELYQCQDGKIDEWNLMGLSHKFDLNLNSVAKRDTVERIDVNNISSSEFIENYEKYFKPLVLTNVTRPWPAKDKWTFEHFLKHHKNDRFKCGEDDSGYNVKLKFKYYYYYMKTNHDDSPLYLFDGNFGEHNIKKQLLKDYSLPEYFTEDLFKYVGHDRRPPYRWIVIGSPRSGTGIHIDPLGTSAWNALLVGYKRWCLFPTSAPADLLKLSVAYGGKQKNEAVQWFNKIYPLTQQPSWPQQFKPIEILQKPGETVFVPSGWWHVVLNMTDTIAITQNFVSSTNFPIVWHKTVRSRPKLSQRWFTQLQLHRPDLVDLAGKVDINSPIEVNSDSSSGWSNSSSSSSSISSDYDNDDDDHDNDHKSDSNNGSGRGSANSNSSQNSDCKSYCTCSSCNSSSSDDDTNDSGKASFLNRNNNHNTTTTTTPGCGTTSSAGATTNMITTTNTNTNTVNVNTNADTNTNNNKSSILTATMVNNKIQQQEPQTTVQSNKNNNIKKRKYDTSADSSPSSLSLSL